MQDSSACLPRACALLPQKLIRYMTQGIDMSAAFVPATKWVLAQMVVLVESGLPAAG